MLPARQADIVRKLIKAGSDPAAGRRKREAAGDAENHSLWSVVVYLRAQAGHVKSKVRRNGILADFGSREMECIDCGRVEQVCTAERDRIISVMPINSAAQ